MRTKDQVFEKEKKKKNNFSARLMRESGLRLSKFL